MKSILYLSIYMMMAGLATAVDDPAASLKGDVALDEKDEPARRLVRFRTYRNSYDSSSDSRSSSKGGAPCGRDDQFFRTCEADSSSFLLQRPTHNRYEYYREKYQRRLSDDKITSWAAGTEDMDRGCNDHVHCWADGDDEIECEIRIVHADNKYCPSDNVRVNIHWFCC